MTSIDLRLGDCLEVMKSIPNASIDAIITDPPYPEIDRDYGRLTEAQWWDLMMGVCLEGRRVLKPTGSAVFILQPNSRRVGEIRNWLWKFMYWVSSEWNMVQDFIWWNYTAMPTKHCDRTVGLARPSAKYCVWAGSPDCYRNQDAVLLNESDTNKYERLSTKMRPHRYYKPSGHNDDESNIRGAAGERGGTTPFNVLPIQSANRWAKTGHGASTPFELMAWWVRYITPKGGMVLDPFMGEGTTGDVCTEYECDFVGIEKMPEHFYASHDKFSIKGFGNAHRA